MLAKQTPLTKQMLTKQLRTIPLKPKQLNIHALVLTSGFSVFQLWVCIALHAHVVKNGFETMWDLLQLS